MTIAKREVNTEEEQKEITTSTKVAVYGSLRKGLGNHSLLKNSKMLGTFESQPEYSMYSVHGHYPGLVTGGTTSIIMEVYEVDDETERRLDMLEGFKETGNPYNHYEKESVSTPYGDACIYLYNVVTTGLHLVESGDWVQYKEASILVNGATC